MRFSVAIIPTCDIAVRALSKEFELGFRRKHMIKFDGWVGMTHEPGWTENLRNTGEGFVINARFGITNAVRNPSPFLGTFTQDLFPVIAVKWQRWVPDEILITLTHTTRLRSCWSSFEKHTAGKDLSRRKSGSSTNVDETMFPSITTPGSSYICNTKGLIKTPKRFEDVEPAFSRLSKLMSLNTVSTSSFVAAH